MYSCGDNIKTEKDKYPNIPKFPKFENDVLKLVEVKTIELKLDSTVHHQEGNYLRTRYLVKDSTLYLITFFADVEEPEHFMNSDKEYTVDLVVIKDNKIQHTQWSDDDFKLNFKIDKLNNDLTIGKHKFFAKSNYYKQDAISDYKNEYGNDTVFSSYLGSKLSGYFQPTSFERILVASKSKIGGAQNSPFLIKEYEPIYLSYYNLNFKNKTGRTKVYDSDPPSFIKLKDELYYFEQENITIDEKNKILKIIIYKIE